MSQTLSHSFSIIQSTTVSFQGEEHRGKLPLGIVLSNQKHPLEGHRKRRRKQHYNPLPVFFLALIRTLLTKSSPARTVSSLYTFLSALLSLSLPVCFSALNFGTFSFPSYSPLTVSSRLS